MFTVKPAVIPGHSESDPKKQYQAHKCVADLRNTGKVTKVLVKYLHKVVHVYVDTQNGYKFCLAVQFDRFFPDYHIAFTAATGQVADNMDVLEVTTRYLADSDLDLDDSKFGRLGSASTAHRFSGPFWFVVSLFGFALTAFAAYELITFKRMSNNYSDAVRLCTKFDASYLKAHHISHAVLTFLLMIGGTWLMFLLNLVLAVYRGYLWKIKQEKSTPASHTSVNQYVLSTETRQMLSFGVYLISLIMYISHLIG